MTYQPAPVGGLADILISVLEKGVVLVLRLEGAPGDRRLVVGLGLAESAGPLMLALGVTGHLGRRPDAWDEWSEIYE